MKTVLKFSIIGIIMLSCFGLVINRKEVYDANEPLLLKKEQTRNVAYSKWIPINKWYNTTALGRPARAYQIHDKNIERTSLEKGKLLVYAQINNSSDVTLLPANIQNEDGEFRYDYMVGDYSELKILSMKMYGEFTPVKNPDRFKCLYIPNEVLQQMNVDLQDYQAVKEALDLID